jgi:PAS domain S-box-containing protein
MTPYDPPIIEPVPPFTAMSKTSHELKKKNSDGHSEGSFTSNSSGDGSFDANVRKLSSVHGKSTCEGMLKQKEKGLFGMDSWNQHFYCIISQGLYKLQSHTNNNVKESWALKDSKVIDFDQLSGKANTFGVFMKDGTKVVLHAENPFDKQRWMASISSASQKERVPHAFVLESLNDAAIGSDSDGIMRAVNDKGVKMFGYSKKEELLGQNVSILMAPSMAKLHDGFLKKYHETGAKSLIGNVRTLVGKAKDGTLFPVEISLGETDQEDCRYLSIFRPVVEEEKKEEEISELEMKSSIECDVLKAKLEDDLDEEIDIVRLKLFHGFDELKKKLQEMILEDEKSKRLLNDLYGVLKKTNAETKFPMVAKNF